MEVIDLCEIRGDQRWGDDYCCEIIGVRQWILNCNFWGSANYFRWIGFCKSTGVIVVNACHFIFFAYSHNGELVEGTKQERNEWDWIGDSIATWQRTLEELLQESAMFDGILIQSQYKFHFWRDRCKRRCNLRAHKTRSVRNLFLGHILNLDVNLITCLFRQNCNYLFHWRCWAINKSWTIHLII
jgi:hypothetical protein